MGLTRFGNVRPNAFCTREIARRLYRFRIRQLTRVPARCAHDDRVLRVVYKTLRAMTTKTRLQVLCWPLDFGRDGKPFFNLII